jgi:uncharacterized membrane protein YhaH (DUF805 family)
MDYFIGALKKYADFSGRARRTEFWMFMLFYTIFYLVLALVGSLLGTELLALLFSLALLVPSLSIGARRLHDTGRSGWWQLIYIVPIIGFIVLIVFFVQDSHDENSYGDSPKAVAAS